MDVVGIDGVVMDFTIRHDIVEVINREYTWRPPIEHAVDRRKRMVDFGIVSKTDKNDQIGQLFGLILGLYRYREPKKQQKYNRLP